MRRASREIALSRDLAPGKPKAAPALSFCIAGMSLDQTFALIAQAKLAAQANKRAARRNRAARPLLLGSEQSMPKNTAIKGSCLNHGAAKRACPTHPGHARPILAPSGSGLKAPENAGSAEACREFGITAALRPGASAVNPPATVPYGAAGMYSPERTETRKGLFAGHRSQSTEAIS